MDKVIPSRPNEPTVVRIPKFATLIVALVLIAFSLIYLLKSSLIVLLLPSWLLQFIYWFIPTLFILRAIGEFKYVGFFKQVKNTDFAKADSKLFSPFCLLIGFVGFFIQFLG